MILERSASTSRSIATTVALRPAAASVARSPSPALTFLGQRSRSKSAAAQSRMARSQKDIQYEKKMMAYLMIGACLKHVSPHSSMCFLLKCVDRAFRPSMIVSERDCFLVQSHMHTPHGVVVDTPPEFFFQVVKCTLMLYS